jgi:hypothetical protein
MEKVKLPEAWPLSKSVTRELADKFAIAALPAIITRYGGNNINETAEEAYRLAYAMLLARVKFQEQVL